MTGTRRRQFPRLHWLYLEQLFLLLIVGSTVLMVMVVILLRWMRKQELEKSTNDGMLGNVTTTTLVLVSTQLFLNSLGY